MIKEAEASSSLFGPPSPGDGTLGGYNHILPVIRVGQHRVLPSDCSSLGRLLQGDYKGWSTQCYPQYSTHDENRHSYGNLSCPRDRQGRSAFVWSDLAGTRFPGESFLPWASIRGYSHDYPSESGFVFDTYANSSEAAVAEQVRCLREKGWIDAATRGVYAKFFAFNPNLRLFLRVTLLLEIDRSGQWRPSVDSTVFEEIDGWTVAAEAIVLAFVVYYIILLVCDIGSHVWRTGSCLLWMFSVWRWLEVANLAIFVSVFFYKIGHWTSPHHELRIGPDTPESIRNHPLAFDEDWYNSLIFMRLDNTMSNARVVSNLSAFNGVLVYLKVLKFFKRSPRLRIVSETVKDAASPIIAIVVYLFLITQAYAMMGVSIWGTRLRDMRTLPDAWAYLLLSLSGSSNLKVLTETEPEYAYMFFVTYQLLVWLVVLSIVVGVVASSYERVRAWHKRMCGDAPLGPHCRNAVAHAELRVRERLGHVRQRSVVVRRALLLLLSAGEHGGAGAAPVPPPPEADAQPLRPEKETTQLVRSILAQREEVTVADLIGNAAAHLPPAREKEDLMPCYALHISWEVIDSRTATATKMMHTFSGSAECSLKFPPRASEIYPKIVAGNKVKVSDGVSIPVGELYRALLVIRQDASERRRLLTKARRLLETPEASCAVHPIDAYPLVSQHVIATALLENSSTLKKIHARNYEAAVASSMAVASQLCLLVSPQQLRRKAAHASLVSYLQRKDARVATDEEAQRESNLAELQLLQKPLSSGSVAVARLPTPKGQRPANVMDNTDTNDYRACIGSVYNNFGRSQPAVKEAERTSSPENGSVPFNQLPTGQRRLLVMKEVTNHASLYTGSLRMLGYHRFSRSPSPQTQSSQLGGSPATTMPSRDGAYDADEMEEDHNDRSFISLDFESPAPSTEAVSDWPGFAYLSQSSACPYITVTPPEPQETAPFA
ncbi:Polycystin-2 [Diplonema papillatum]|nr:Polycystin-2 [Diplonema papillatum]